jgi:hypothetical protein
VNDEGRHTINEGGGAESTMKSAVTGPVARETVVTVQGVSRSSLLV